MKYTFAVLAVVLVLAFPGVILAEGLVPCGGPGEVDCQLCHFVTLAENILQWLVKVLTIVTAIVFVWAGTRMATSGGDAAVKQASKKLIIKTATGFVIVLAAWLIVDFSIKALSDSDLSWSSVGCSVQPVVGGKARLTASGNNVDPFDPGEVSVAVSAVNNSGVDGLVVDAALLGGLDTAEEVNLFRALIYVESENCTMETSPDTNLEPTYGCSQVSVSTARLLDPSLNESTDEEIIAHLTDDVQYSLFLGAQYLDYLLGIYEEPADALAVYNAGPSAIQQSFDCSDTAQWQCSEDEEYLETVYYVQNIQAIASSGNLSVPALPPSQCTITMEPNTDTLTTSETRDLTVSCESSTDLIYSWSKNSTDLGLNSSTINASSQTPGGYYYEVVATNSVGSAETGIWLTFFSPYTDSSSDTGSACYGDPGIGSGFWVPPNTVGRVVADQSNIGMVSYVPGCVNGKKSINSSSGCALNDSYGPATLSSGKHLLIRYMTPAVLDDVVTGIKVTSFDGGPVGYTYLVWLSKDPTASYDTVPEGCRSSSTRYPTIPITSQTASVPPNVPVCRLDPNSIYYFGIEYQGPGSTRVQVSQNVFQWYDEAKLNFANYSCEPSTDDPEPACSEPSGTTITNPVAKSGANAGMTFDRIFDAPGNKYDSYLNSPLETHALTFTSDFTAGKIAWAPGNAGGYGYKDFSISKCKGDFSMPVGACHKSGEGDYGNLFYSSSPSKVQDCLVEKGATYYFNIRAHSGELQSGYLLNNIVSIGSDTNDTDNTNTNVEDNFTLTISKPEGTETFGQINTSSIYGDVYTVDNLYASLPIDISKGTTVTLAASPYEGYSFTGWSGDCASAGTDPICVITMDSDKDVYANFSNDNNYVLTISKPEGTETFGQINTSPIYGDVYTAHNLVDSLLIDAPRGSMVTLTASPYEGYYFTGWSGDCASAGKDPVCIITMDSDKKVYANFSSIGLTYIWNEMPHPCETWPSTTCYGFSTFHDANIVPIEIRFTYLYSRENGTSYDENPWWLGWTSGLSGGLPGDTVSVKLEVRSADGKTHTLMVPMTIP